MRSIDFPVRWFRLGVLGAIAALAGCLAGCGPGRYTPEGLCAAEAEAFCSFQYHCCTPSERFDAFDSKLLVHDDEAACVEVYTRSLCNGDARLADSVAGGRATWDEAKAAACYEPLFAAFEGCDAETVITFTGQGGACDDYVAGSVKEGAACYEDYECTSKSSVCVPNVSGDPDKPLITSKGTCQAAPGEGEDCYHFKCAEGLFCDLGPGLCAPLKADGEACMDSGQCLSKLCDFTTSECTSTDAPGVFVDMCDGLDD